MQWSEYSKMHGNLYTPELKQMASNRSKLVIAEGLCEKNLLRVGKIDAPTRSMESDLRRFVTGKSILNEVAPLVAAAVPAILGAGEVAVGGAGAAATGAAATGAATGAVAGETAATTAVANTAATSLASDDAVVKLAGDMVSNTKVGDTSQTSHPNDQEVTNED